MSGSENTVAGELGNGSMSKQNSLAISIARWTTLAGFFCLLALLLNWFTWLSPPKTVPRALPLIVLVVPLMFALRGLLYARVYTHAWVSLLSMLYFTIGVDVAFNRADQRLLGGALIVFSLMLFFGTISFNFLKKKQRKRQQEESKSDQSLSDSNT